MDQKAIKPINSTEFSVKIKTAKTVDKIDYLAYFKQQIDHVKDFAIGPYYWFIPDNSGPRTVAASESFSQLTPYTVKELIEKSETPQFFAENIQTDDRHYVLSAIQMAMKTSEEYHQKALEVPKFNIYCRMLNASSQFVWRLIQFPAIFFNELGQAEGVFVLVTDLSQISEIKKPMMTMIDYSQTERQFFTVLIDTRAMQPLLLPKITEREKQVIKLISKGYNNPLIAKELHISINTVQNHKRNLREKTNTKTAAELVNYFFVNSLF